MSANPIEDNTTPKATGSLEELFRHHLGEEAAVPPRPMLWDQIDNSLLIRQNETYRRRLVATRWVAAASLLLATLAGTGWWAGRTDLVGSPEMATTTATRPALRRGQLNAPAAHPGFGQAENAGSVGTTTGSGASVAATTPQQAASGLRNGESQGAAGRRGGFDSSASASSSVASARRPAFGRGLNEAAGAASATFSRLGRQGATSNNAALTMGRQQATTVAATEAATVATQAGSVAMQRAELPASTSAAANLSNTTTGAVAIGGTTTAAGAGTTLATGSVGIGALATPAAATALSSMAATATVAVAPAACVWPWAE